ncbi:hypothetical protein [Cohnella abietis]|uniref:hypothetical protein n=1 Tax=Cohnella abietis TaxID=2507935 RepID=UPI00102ECD8C|nr:hypothetical protein [Cohnella abietis]
MSVASGLFSWTIQTVIINSDGKLGAFVATAGTGGAIRGTGESLRPAYSPHSLYCRCGAVRNALCYLVVNQGSITSRDKPGGEDAIHPTQQLALK